MNLEEEQAQIIVAIPISIETAMNVSIGIVPLPNNLGEEVNINNPLYLF